MVLEYWMEGAILFLKRGEGVWNSKQREGKMGGGKRWWGERERVSGWGRPKWV